MRVKSVLKPLLLSLGLAAVSHAGVYDNNPSQAYDGTYSNQPNYSYIHNAFYFEASLGFQYVSISDKNKYDDDDYYSWRRNRVYETDFSGFGPEFSARFGGIIGSRVALFSYLGLSSMKSANYEYVEKEDGDVHFAKKNSEGGVRFGVGGGVNVYFVRDPSNPLYGLYVGASAGIIGYYLGDDDSEFDKRRQTESWDEPYFSESAVALGLEVGKLWHVTEMWNVGVASQLSLDSPQRDEDDDNLYCILTFKVTIVRK